MTCISVPQCEHVISVPVDSVLLIFALSLRNYKSAHIIRASGIEPEELGAEKGSSIEMF